MKTKTLGFVAMLAIGCLALAGCNKSENAEIANPASVYCEENGGTLVIEEGAGLCMFEDGSYCEERSYKNGECQPGMIMYNSIDESIVPEGNKTSLTNEELDEIAETNFPKGYDYSVYNAETQEIMDENYTYPEDISHSLLIPEHATMASREIVSSGIEDGMIYTLTNVTLQDDTIISILYIVDPETLDFVAANVENGHIVTNYQFVY